MQRGGSPCPYDRVFASRLGSEAGKLILDNQYGFMVGYKNREIVRVPLEDVAGKLKTVDPDATIVGPSSVGCSQFTVFAKIFATVVLPVPLVPVNRYAWPIRFARS